VNQCKPKCAVRWCPHDEVSHGLCVVHALLWLLHRDSAPTHGREERLRRYVERQDVRATLRKATSAASFTPPDTRPVCGRCEQPALESGECAAHVADEVGI